MSPGDISRKKVGSWFDENMTMVTHKAASFHLYNMGILESILLVRLICPLSMLLLWVA